MEILSDNSILLRVLPVNTRARSRRPTARASVSAVTCTFSRCYLLFTERPPRFKWPTLQPLHREDSSEVGVCFCQSRDSCATVFYSVLIIAASRWKLASPVLLVSFHAKNASAHIYSPCNPPHFFLFFFFFLSPVL